MADVWEERVAAAVKKVYAEADLKLEALQLDLLEPHEDGTRWTAQQVKVRRTTEALAALRDGFQEFGRGITAVAAAASKAVAALSAVFDTTTRDDYALAADSGDTP